MDPLVEDARLDECEQQHEAEEDDGDRGRDARAEELEALGVHRVEQDFRSLAGAALGQHVHRVEHLERADRRDQHHEHRHRTEHRPRDEPEPRPGRARAVHFGRLVERARDRDEARQEQHHVEAEELPHADCRERRQHERGIAEPRARRQADRLQHQVDQPELRMQHVFPRDRHGDQRGHHGDEENRAVEAAQRTSRLDEERDAEPQRHGRRHHDGDIEERVGERFPEHPVREEFAIVGEADDAPGRGAELVVGERHDHHDHDRPQEEQRHQDQRGREKAQRDGLYAAPARGRRGRRADGRGKVLAGAVRHGRPLLPQRSTAVRACPPHRSTAHPPARR